MEDQRAHARIDSLESIMSKHIEEHQNLSSAIIENTQLTRTISENTAELVLLVKGVKGLRAIVLWLAPFVAIIYGAWAWVVGHK